VADLGGIEEIPKRGKGVLQAECFAFRRNGFTFPLFGCSLHTFWQHRKYACGAEKEKLQVYLPVVFFSHHLIKRGVMV
jgi:hypothetical protein